MIKIDFHIHSVYSKDSLTKLNTLHKVFNKRNLFPVITDHNTIQGAAKFKQLYGECIVGEEIMTRDGEIIGLFLHDEIKPGLSAIETVEKIREQDGIVYIPHPFDKFRHNLKILNIKPDIIEVYNPRVISQKHNLLAEQFAEKNNILKATGSDSHFSWHIGSCHTIIEDFNDKKELLKNLKKAKLIKKPTPAYAFVLTGIVQRSKFLFNRF